MSSSWRAPLLLRLLSRLIPGCRPRSPGRSSCRIGPVSAIGAERGPKYGARATEFADIELQAARGQLHEGLLERGKLGRELVEDDGTGCRDLANPGGLHLGNGE